MSQVTFSDVEYSNRKRKTKREEFLDRDEQNASPKSERRRMKKLLERSRWKTRAAKQTLVKKDKSRLKNMKSMQLSNTFDRFQAAVRTVRFSDNGR